MPDEQMTVENASPTLKDELWYLSRVSTLEGDGAKTARVPEGFKRREES